MYTSFITYFYIHVLSPLHLIPAATAIAIMWVMNQTPSWWMPAFPAGKRRSVCENLTWTYTGSRLFSSATNTAIISGVLPTLAHKYSIGVHHADHRTIRSTPDRPPFCSVPRWRARGDRQPDHSPVFQSSRCGGSAQFVISSNGVHVGVFTDIGKVCDNLVYYFSQCHAAYLEANYDEDMLEHGRYPIHLKTGSGTGKAIFPTARRLNFLWPTARRTRPPLPGSPVWSRTTTPIKRWRPLPCIKRYAYQRGIPVRSIRTLSHPLKQYLSAAA